MDTKKFYENGILNNEGIIELRKEVSVGSVYTSDYENELGLSAESVCDFFDNYYCRYINELVEDELEKYAEDDENRPSYDVLWDEFDNTENLLKVWEDMEENPFENIAVAENRETRERYSFVKPGEVICWKPFFGYNEMLLYVDSTFDDDELIAEDTVIVCLELGGDKREVPLCECSEVCNGDKYDAMALKENIEYFKTYKEGTWERDFFSNCCDDLYYGYGWGWIKDNDDFVKEYGEDECKKVFDVAYNFMSTAA
jgi:hypothetical protein